MRLIADLFQDALTYEESLLAHAIMIGMRKGLWAMGDAENTLDWTLLDLEEVQAARDRNELGMNRVHVYSSPLGNAHYAIFFAETLQDAHTAFLKAFKRKARVIHHLPHGMDVTTYQDGLNDAETWRAIRNKHKRFPVLAGIYKKEK